MIAKDEIFKKADEYSGIGLIPIMLEEVACLLDNLRCKKIYFEINSNDITYFIENDCYCVMKITQNWLNGIVIEHYYCGNVTSIKTLSNEMINDQLKNKIEKL